MESAIQSVREAHQAELDMERQSLEETIELLSRENGRLHNELHELQEACESLESKNDRKKQKINTLKEIINDLITCLICLEQFQSAGERFPCKLNCPHIICKRCADDRLQRVSFKWFITYKL